MFESCKFIPLSFKGFQKLPGVYIMKNSINNKLYVGESINVWHRMFLHRNKDRKQVISSCVGFKWKFKE